MITFERIRWDEEGDLLPLDGYFDYIEAVGHQMPDDLRTFATSQGSYTLQGKYSLHDARTLSFSVTKECIEGGVSNATSMVVRFMDQLFEDSFSLHYTGVSSFTTTESELLSRRASDVLIHEFSVIAPQRFRHVVLYDGGGGYVVEFSGFSRTLA